MLGRVKGPDRASKLTRPASSPYREPEANIVLIPPLSAQQLAYIHLQDRIVSGALPGGTRLKPEALAQQLGISRMPVREAIRQLNAEGYVTIMPNRGAVVTDRTPEQVIELFEMRAVLEGLAAGIAANVATADELRDLESFNTGLLRLGQDHVSWVERHDQFHDQLCLLSRRQRLCAEARRLRLAVRPYLRLYTRSHAEFELKGHEHERLIEEIRSGNVKRAESVTRAHVMANAHSMAECLRIAREEAASAPAAKPASKPGSKRAAGKAPATRRKKSAAG